MNNPMLKYEYIFIKDYSVTMQSQQGGDSVTISFKKGDVVRGEPVLSPIHLHLQPQIKVETKKAIITTPSNVATAIPIYVTVPSVFLTSYISNNNNINHPRSFSANGIPTGVLLSELSRRVKHFNLTDDSDDNFQKHYGFNLWGWLTGVPSYMDNNGNFIGDKYYEAEQDAEAGDVQSMKDLMNLYNQGDPEAIAWVNSPNHSAVVLRYFSTIAT